MRTRSSELSVMRVEQHLADDPVLEMQLVDIKGSFFFGEPGIEPAAFVEVCGAQARSRGSSVALLHFQRCDRFYEITNENLELAACRQELEAAEFSVDLGVHNFGISKKGGLPRTLCNVQAVVNSRTRSNRTRNLRHPVAWQETTLGSLVSSPSAGVQQDCEQ